MRELTTTSVTQMRCEMAPRKLLEQFRDWTWQNGDVDRDGHSRLQRHGRGVRNKRNEMLEARHASGKRGRNGT
jgi:hypothetical protein